MIVRWRRRQPGYHTAAGADVDTPATTDAVCRGNVPINLAVAGAVEQVARIINFRTTRGEYNRDGWEHMLTIYGPLLYAGRARGYRGMTAGSHAVVIRGIDGDNLLINDPWEPGVGLQHTMFLSGFFMSFPRIEGAPILHI
jgi:hypothetical protein